MVRLGHLGSSMVEIRGADCIPGGAQGAGHASKKGPIAAAGRPYGPCARRRSRIIPYVSSSLRDQLIAAGLASEKQGKQVSHQHRQRGRSQGQPAVSEEQKRATREAQASKAARDQELNQKQQLKAEKKARLAEIRQLIEQHQLPRIESDELYNFVDDQKIRSIPVDAARRARLNSGELAIVRCAGRYEVVPAETAARIRERNERSVIARNVGEPVVAVDDPYKDFAVPDDLTW